MARALRIDSPGLTYHAWANGVDGRSIFKTPVEKDFMLTLLRDEVDLSNWTCLSYVVMTTHYHLVVHLNESTLSSGFQRLNTRFAQWFNKENGRRGHVFESRFNCNIVDSHFGHLEVCRYVALNPVKAQMCRSPEHYAWSGYGAIVGDALPDDIVDIDAARALAGSRPAFRKFVDEPDVRIRRGQALARPQNAGRPPSVSIRRRAA
jgi:putative transposase